MPPGKKSSYSGRNSRVLAEHHHEKETKKNELRDNVSKNIQSVIATEF